MIRTQMILNQSIILYVLIGSGIWLLSLSFLVWRAMRHYGRLTKNITKKDLKSLLEKILKEVETNKSSIKKLEKGELEILNQAGFHIQKIGLVRFNPFNETGGNQSFSLALLDNHDSGVVLSSLHSRNSTRLYTKRIKKGKIISGGEFSKEEKQAMKKAQKKVKKIKGNLP